MSCASSLDGALLKSRRLRAPISFAGLSCLKLVASRWESSVAPGLSLSCTQGTVVIVGTCSAPQCLLQSY